MTLGSRLRSWLRATFQRTRVESEMDAELRFHMEAFAEDLVRAGAPARRSNAPRSHRVRRNRARKGRRQGSARRENH